MRPLLSGGADYVILRRQIQNGPPNCYEFQLADTSRVMPEALATFSSARS